MGSGNLARCGARRLPARREIEQRAYLVQREAQFAGPPQESEPAYVLGAVASVTAAAWRRRQQADPFVITNRLNVTACPTREPADAHHGFGHVQLPENRA
jgi:hypothetical protein